MIVLDTNILSEAMRPEPTQAVMDWLDRQPVSISLTLIGGIVDAFRLTAFSIYIT